MIYENTNSNGVLVWVDLLNPTKEEIKTVQSQYGVKIPSRAQLEQSSRCFKMADNIVNITLPNVIPLGSKEVPAPLGFVITPKILFTIRFFELASFEMTKSELKRDKTKCHSLDVFSYIIEQIVDMGAVTLEKLGVEVNLVSSDVFGQYSSQRQFYISRSNKNLRRIILHLGKFTESLSQIREIQIGLLRVLPFLLEKGQGLLTPNVDKQLKTVMQDIQSLSDFESHLTNKIQFLLDAILGFINTEQNDIFKVLTIASVIGIPPTFIASWYGMNFHIMPELVWAHGYLYVIGITLLSIILPLLWFKWRGWL